MQARGPLMIEHRLIERMLKVIQSKLVQSGNSGMIDPFFVDRAVDFISIYADRTHHGKEEDILFRELKNRNLSDADRKTMSDLIKEHEFGRKATRDLIGANNRYRNGDGSALADIVSCLGSIVDFYPKHIEKEDKVFFPAARAYFTEVEDQALLAEFRDFDRRMIHEKYKEIVGALEK